MFEAGFPIAKIAFIHRSVSESSVFNNIFIAVGTNGEIQISSDGINWIHQSNYGGYIHTFYGAGYMGSNVSSIYPDYEIRVLANSTIPAGYYWELFGLQMYTDVLTLRELQFINPLVTNQLYARRSLIERTSFPAFSELALKDNVGNCVLYASFPKIQWDNNMYGNCCFNIQLT